MTEGKASTLGFEEAYSAHRLTLLRLAYLMSGSHELSEDAVQSAFTSAHARWDQIEQPLAHLKKAVINLVKDGQRRRFRLLASTPERDVGPGSAAAVGTAPREHERHDAGGAPQSVSVRSPSP